MKDFGAVPNEVKKLAETILESSSSHTIIVQDFLDISNIEQGKMKSDFSVVDLSKLAYDVAEALAPNIERKQLRVKPETLTKLFQKFSRAEDASKANIHGTGLGLYEYFPIGK